MMPRMPRGGGGAPEGPSVYIRLREPSENADEGPRTSALPAAWGALLPKRGRKRAWVPGLFPGRSRLRSTQRLVAAIAIFALVLVLYARVWFPSGTLVKARVDRQHARVLVAPGDLDGPALEGMQAVMTAWLADSDASVGVPLWLSVGEPQSNLPFAVQTVTLEQVASATIFDELGAVVALHCCMPHGPPKMGETTHVQLSETAWTAAGQALAQLPLVALQQWHVPQVRLIVLVNNRVGPLSRLVASLTAAEFLGDVERGNVRLHVQLDGQATAAVVAVAEGAVSAFSQRSGRPLDHTLQRRLTRAGLLHAVVESWYPTHSDEYGVFLEDDIELSDQFYVWLKYALLRYRHGGVRASVVAGIALYTPQVCEVGSKRRGFAPLASRDGLQAPFLLQLPCSWGQAYFPEHWRVFREYVQLRAGYTAPGSLNGSDLRAATAKAAFARNVSAAAAAVSDVGALVRIPHYSRVNTWARSWKRFLSELFYWRGWVMLYPRMAVDRGTAALARPDADPATLVFPAFSTNHMAPGDHVRDDTQRNYSALRTLYRIPLLSRNVDTPSATITSETADAAPRVLVPASRVFPWPRLPSVERLALYDFWHREVSGGFEEHRRWIEGELSGVLGNVSLGRSN